MNIFQYKNVRMQNISNFVSIIDIWMNQEEVGMRVLVNLFIRSVIRNLTLLVQHIESLDQDHPMIWFLCVCGLGGGGGLAEYGVKLIGVMSWGFSFRGRFLSVTMQQHVMLLRRIQVLWTHSRDKVGEQFGEWTQRFEHSTMSFGDIGFDIQCTLILSIFHHAFKRQKEGACPFLEDDLMPR